VLELIIFSLFIVPIKPHLQTTRKSS
jgi:hypothetical protein